MDETGRYLFMAKEMGHDSVTWYVGMEPYGPSITIFNENYLAIELTDPTYENAKAVADYLNEHVAQLHITRLPSRRS